MKNAYIYPNSVKKKEAKNPYINDFVASLTPYFIFLNQSKHSNSGIFDLFKYINKTDLIFFHWIEDIPDKRGGYFQTMAFYILMLIIKIKKIKIVYTLHNKESHYITKRIPKQLIKKTILKYSDYIICHASEGLKITRKKNVKIKYIPHPFKEFSKNNDSVDKLYDILIWGSIRPYKGIDEYLKYLEANNLQNKYKTYIIGEIYPPEYETELMKFNSDNIHIENKFIADSTLNELISKSRITLFTYNEKSVLSSGALVYSLSQGAIVIGPKTGAFLDLYSEGLLDVFEDYYDLIKRINFHLNQPNIYLKKISQFTDSNNWKSYGENIFKWVEV